MLNRSKILSTTIAGVVAATLLLSGCSSGNGGGGSDNFETPKFTTAPVWDRINFDETAWGGEKNPVGFKGAENLALTSAKGACTMVGTMFYVDSYLETRGDEFLSYATLYDQVSGNSPVIKDAKTETINGINYATGTYTNETITSEGETVYTHTRSAVRVFDKSIKIPGSESMKNVTGIHKSDATKGLPVAQISLQCEDKELITDELWNSGVERFKIDFNDGQTSPLGTSDDEGVTDIPGNNGESDDTPGILKPVPEEDIQEEVTEDTPAVDVEDPALESTEPATTEEVTQ